MRVFLKSWSEIGLLKIVLAILIQKWDIFSIKSMRGFYRPTEGAVSTFNFSASA